VGKLSIIGAACLGVFFALYSMLFPIKMTAFILPFPLFRTFFFKFIYNILFLVLYCLALPAAEIAYYVIFLRDIVPGSNKFIQNLIIAGAYTGTCWFAIIFMFKGFFTQIFITLLCFGLMFGLMHLVTTRNLTPLTVTLRYAFSLAVLIWLIYLCMSRKGWLRRNTPFYYYHGNVKNIWRRGG